MLVSFGKIAVAAAGTPVRATENQTDPALPYFCHAVMVEVDPSNTGKVWVGTSSSMDTATFADVVAILAAPSVNTLPTFSYTISYAINAINLGDLWIDVDTNGEGVVISAIVS